MIRLSLLAALLLLLAGCSSSASGGTPTPASTRTPTSLPTKKYSDKNFRFSFSYPATWSLKAGALAPGDPSTYIVHVTLPKGEAQLEVEDTSRVIALPRVKDGEKHKDPNGPDYFQYFNAKVEGLAALTIVRLSNGQPDEVATFVTVGHHQYVVRMVTGTPPFSASANAGYNTVVRSLKVPFS